MENISSYLRPLRILIADDHEVVRRGLRIIIESQPGWQVCAEATNGREAVEKASECLPDLALLDISMPELNGLEAASRILQFLPKAEILILTVHDSDVLEKEAVDRGANGYVVKSRAARDLVAAIQSLSQHKPYLRSKLAKSHSGDFQVSRSRRQLTARQVEVARLLADGKSNSEIAKALGISVKTAETHRANIMRRLGVHSAGELARYALRENLIQLP
ncbi:MAG TPA: response regulator transcription factor [Acidobacteriota bacterium]|jgi:DNA-binding NarL/FixJ family response regulator